MRLCQNVGTTSFIFYSSAIFSFGYAALSSCIWQQVAIFQLYRVINSSINIYLATVMSPFPSFISLAHIFLILKAIAKKAKSIVTLSSPICRNLLYAMLYFICPNTASGSIHLLPLCLIPSSESNLSRACRLYWFNRWLTSIIRFPPSFKTTATQRATFASFCFIPGTFGDVSARSLVTFGSYTVHVLSHRTNVIILLGIVMETFGMERVGSITGTLFFMEVIVLDEGFYPILLHEPVIFFRTVTGVCHTDIR